MKIQVEGEDWFDVANKVVEALAGEEFQKDESFHPTWILEAARLLAWDLPSALSLLLDDYEEDAMHDIEDADFEKLIAKFPESEYHIRHYEGYSKFDT